MPRKRSEAQLELALLEVEASVEEGPRASGGSRPSLWSVPLDLLPIALEHMVPLWITELRHLSRGQRKAMAEEAARELSTVGGESVQLPVHERPAKRKPPKGLTLEDWQPMLSTAEAFNVLARGLACLSYQPGGVRAFGLHFEVRP